MAELIEAAELIEETADPDRELDTYIGDAGLGSPGPAASCEQLAKPIARMKRPRLRSIPVTCEQRTSAVLGRDVEVTVQGDCDIGSPRALVGRAAKQPNGNQVPLAREFCEVAIASSLSGLSNLAARSRTTLGEADEIDPPQIGCDCVRNIVVSSVDRVCP